MPASLNVSHAPGTGQIKVVGSYGDGDTHEYALTPMMGMFFAIRLLNAVQVEMDLQKMTGTDYERT